MEVWKYPITLNGRVDLPINARILHVDLQEGRPHFWALVDPEAPTVQRDVVVYGTGHPIEGWMTWIGTFIDEAFVWHVFISPEPI